MKVFAVVSGEMVVKEIDLPVGTFRLLLEIDGRRYYVGGRHPSASAPAERFLVSTYPYGEARGLVVRPLDPTSVLLDTVAL